MFVRRLRVKPQIPQPYGRLRSVALMGHTWVTNTLMCVYWYECVTWTFSDVYVCKYSGR